MAGFLLAALFASSGVAVHPVVRAHWNGRVRVIDALTREPVESAYLVAKSPPIGSEMVLLMILARSDGRTFRMTGSDGVAVARAIPLGSLTAWKRGYWPEHVDLGMASIASHAAKMDSETLEIELSPVLPSQERLALRQASHWLDWDSVARLTPLVENSRTKASYSDKLRYRMFDEVKFGSAR